MVIEFLTFRIDPDDRAEWLSHEEHHWSRFLEQQDGFVSKQMWAPVDDPTTVHAVIWWESEDHWKSIPRDELDAVAAAMGPHEREPTMTAYRVIREC